MGVADSAEGMADLIVSLLRDPATRESRLSVLYDHISSTFTWSKRTDELLEIVGVCVNGMEIRQSS